MARPSKSSLPQHLELNPHNKIYYYKNSLMPRKQRVGSDRKVAIELAKQLNDKYRLHCEREAAKRSALIDLGGVPLADALSTFVEKYVADFRLKSSTATRLRQRADVLMREMGDIQVPAIDTRMLREAIAGCSQFEQTKIKTLASRFFRYAKSTGLYPSHLPNPVADLYIDPVPSKVRQRMTVNQFRAIYSRAPEWLQWCMTLAFHLALRRIDLVNLTFDDVIGDRIVSAIRKTDSNARGLESTSVDFPIHPDVRRVLSASRVSSLRNGRSPFVVHRQPKRITQRAKRALAGGTLVHQTQVTADHASKAFAKARAAAVKETDLFQGLERGELPTLHEVRALSSHLYERAGYEVGAVQDLMAHTDPDMTRSYQKGHARKVLKIDMLLPFSVNGDKSTVEEPRGVYAVNRQEKFSENFLTREVNNF